MDELELRVGALELLAIEILAGVDAGVLEAAAARIRESLSADLEGDERTMRLQALQHIEDAGRRFLLFTPARKV